MKKIILALIVSFFTVNVYALEKCQDWKIEESINLLESLTYELTYADDHTDMNGNFEESYLRLRFTNLPDGYWAYVYLTEDSFFELKSRDAYAELKGGVYKVSIEAEECLGSIKSFEIKVPSYKQYCNLDIDCEKDIWFDGSYTNSSSNQEKKLENKISIKLLIILIILLVIITICVVFAIRKRRFDAENL